MYELASSDLVRVLHVAEKLLVYFSGDGLGPTIGIGEEAVITVDANDAGTGKATCLITKPDGNLLDADVVENLDGTFDIFYTAPESGPYKVNIYFGGEPVPHSPYRVTVSAFLL